MEKVKTLGAVVEQKQSHSVFVEIDAWYNRAPAALPDNDIVRWVQHNAEIPCPRCGDLLWVLRTRRARGPGFYHLAMCQSEDCTFQIDD